MQFTEECAVYVYDAAAPYRIPLKGGHGLQTANKLPQEAYPAGECAAKESESHKKLLSDLLSFKKSRRARPLDEAVKALTASNHKQNRFITDVRAGLFCLKQIFAWIKVKQVGRAQYLKVKKPKNLQLRALNEKIDAHFSKKDKENQHGEHAEKQSFCAKRTRFI